MLNLLFFMLISLPSLLPICLDNLEWISVDIFEFHFQCLLACKVFNDVNRALDIPWSIRKKNLCTIYP